jgi:hypothetical protein
MSGDDLATALTTGGAAWMVLSISAVLPILWAFTLVLHFARPYIVGSSGRSPSDSGATSGGSATCSSATRSWS